LWLLGRKALSGHLGAIREIDRAMDAMQVGLDGAFGQPKNAGYLPVGRSRHDDLILVPCESLAQISSSPEAVTGPANLAAHLVRSLVNCDVSKQGKCSGSRALTKNAAHCRLNRIL
jgi:hypothetical protein